MSNYEWNQRSFKQISDVNSHGSAQKKKLPILKKSQHAHRTRISHKAGARLFNNYIIQLPFHGNTAGCNTTYTLTMRWNEQRQRIHSVLCTMKVKHINYCDDLRNVSRIIAANKYKWTSNKKRKITNISMLKKKSRINKTNDVD